MGVKKELTKKAREALEWHLLVKALSGYAASELGARACEDIEPAVTIEAGRRFLNETSEMAELMSNGGAVPACVMDDIRPFVERARKGAVITSRELRQISSMLETARVIKGFFKNMRDSSPLLWERASSLEELSTLKGDIDSAIDEGGNLMENASEELIRLSKQVREKRAHIVDELEEFMKSEGVLGCLQDTYYTQRGTRYVLPVKAEFRGKIEGIVHDSSNSGQTLFIEPRRFIQANNDLKMAEMALEQEIVRILSELSRKAGAHADAIVSNIEILTEIDTIYAKARMAIDLNATAPQLARDGRIYLKSARHPLLVIEGLKNPSREVVANDIELPSEISGMVISGPNTGGKTVTLKLLGLFALMVRAGMLIPSQSGSVMGFFPEVYADIGDEQEIEKHLSSFSGHITNIIGILECAGKGTLVLLDELVTSTDPAEGAALGEAILDALAQKGAKTVVTTHYAQLKAYGETDERFMNASVEFDPQTLSPTYRLIIGAPGGSSAIEIAARLGMPTEIIEQARGFLDCADRKLEELISSLDNRRRELVQAIEKVEEERKSAEKARLEQEKILVEMKKKEKEFKSTVKKKISAEVENARAKVEEILDFLAKEQKRERAIEARRRLAEIEARYTLDWLGESVKAEPSTLMAGKNVIITTIGAKGILLEDAVQGGKSKRKVRVKVGSAEINAPVDALIADAPVEAEKKIQAGQKRPVQESGEKTVAERLDLRGVRVEEALIAVEKFLDHAMLAQLKKVEIVHGHGTGALKKAVRDYLTSSPYVKSWQAGDIRFGGDGVTVVEVNV